MMKIRWIVLLCLMLSGCTSNEINEVDLSTKTPIKEDIIVQEEPSEVKEDIVSESLSEEEILDNKVAIMIENMTLENQVAQMFYTSIEGYQRTKLPVGGIILFKKDLPTKETALSVITQLQKSSEIPLFIGVDEEGGLVSRITGIDSLGGTKIASAWDLSHDDNEAAVYLASKTIGTEIGALGINMNFAPVVDVNSNKENPIIGHRAFSDNPNEVSKSMEQALNGYKKTNIIPVIKHYPGHGDTTGDSHLESVVINRDINQLYEIELIPFITGIKLEVPVIMVGHIQVPQVTGNTEPASLSYELIQELLIDDLGFEGIVITDGLNMNSISNNYTTEEVIDQGIRAGVNIFLMPDDLEKAYDYLLEKSKSDVLFNNKVRESVKKIIKLKIKYEL